MTGKFTKTDTEWRAQLSDLAYQVTRKGATERPFTHDQFPDGVATFKCVCCETPLFESDAKFESGCGWPSFFRPLNEGVIQELDDFTHGMHRIEVQCSHCDAHLGHVFPDGPPPTGLRYCINGVALIREAKS